MKQHHIAKSALFNKYSAFYNLAATIGGNAPLMSRTIHRLARAPFGFCPVRDKSTPQQEPL
jgi:hypothetical protein